VDVVLWPEGAVDLDPLASPDVRNMLDAAAARYGAPILLNAASDRGGATYNTSFLWTQDGPVATHAKHHPVPFGEYIPDRWFYAACADVILEAIEGDAEVSMFQTTNADFRATDENLQQLEFARMRGIEAGRSVINLSTTGTSQAFAPDGSVLAALPADEPGLM